MTMVSDLGGLRRSLTGVRAANRWPLEVIEDAGHLSIERPEAFRAALRSALER
jgi:pimeloyl-ACP methyl ester carboxylesterase